jgi:glycopeptide antibiotics resistance protein
MAPDKRKHFWVGMLMGAIFQFFTLYLFPQQYGFSIIITFILIVAVSYGFELFSLITKRGHYEIMDAVAGTSGGTIGMVIILLLEYIHHS